MFLNVANEGHAFEPRSHFEIGLAFGAPFGKELGGGCDGDAAGYFIEESLGGSEVVDAL